jgi:hypothetical protein
MFRSAIGSASIKLDAQFGKKVSFLQLPFCSGPSPANPAPAARFEGTEARLAMNCPKDAVEFVTEWWELSGNIITTLAALRRLKEAYPRDYLVTFCPPDEIVNGAAALQEICAYLESIARIAQEKR